MFPNGFSFPGVLGRHGESPARPHLRAGGSLRAPQGQRQPQVLPRVRGRCAACLLLEGFTLGQTPLVSDADSRSTRLVFRLSSSRSPPSGILILFIIERHSLSLLTCLHLYKYKGGSSKRVTARWLSSPIFHFIFSTRWRSEKDGNKESASEREIQEASALLRRKKSF